MAENRPSSYAVRVRILVNHNVWNIIDGLAGKAHPVKTYGSVQRLVQCPCYESLEVNLH